MDEDDISHRIIFLALLALLFFILQSVLFTNFFQIGSLVFTAIFSYFMFFVARNSFLHKRELQNNLKVKDREDIRIDFWR